MMMAVKAMPRVQGNMIGISVGDTPVDRVVREDLPGRCWVTEPQE